MKLQIENLIKLVFKILLSVIAFSSVVQAKEKDKTFFNLQAESIDGKTIDFKGYSGKVILAVNVASQCGYTQQYAGLQKLYKKYQDRGLIILGFPSNDFGSQEPGSNSEIKKFCKLNYDVQFPIFSKSPVTGAKKSDVYRFLTSDQKIEPVGEVTWNFEKFLINRQGHVVKRFRSQVEPEAVPLVQAIEHEISTAR